MIPHSEQDTDLLSFMDDSLQCTDYLSTTIDDSFTECTQNFMDYFNWMPSDDAELPELTFEGNELKLLCSGSNSSPSRCSLTHDGSHMISEDVWRKFGVNRTLEDYFFRVLEALERGDDELISNLSTQECDCLMKTLCHFSNCSRWWEILYHDCMWTGLCVNRDHKDHNSYSKKECNYPVKVQSGRSLLIPKQTQSPAQSSQKEKMFNMESDMDCTLRPETPLSSESEAEFDDGYVGPFKHEDFSLQKLSESILSDSKPVHMNEVLGQTSCTRRVFDRRKTDNEAEEDEEVEEEEPECSSGSTVSSPSRTEIDLRTTMSDHCYHLNVPQKMENLGVQTPSDSEEEIDVVSFEKPSRPATTLPTYLQVSTQHHYQQMMSTALREKTKPRARGRPRGSGSRKRTAQAAEMKETTRRAKAPRTYTKRTPNATITSSAKSSGPSTPTKSHHTTDSETDSERRSTHNNMERTRRSQLKSQFEYLRLQVPTIECHEKAAKVEILRQSTAYIHTLQRIYENNDREITVLRARQEMLKKRVGQLRRENASKGWS